MCEKGGQCEHLGTYTPPKSTNPRKNRQRATKKELQARKLEAPFLYQTSVTQLRRRNHPDHPDHQGNHLD